MLSQSVFVATGIGGSEISILVCLLNRQADIAVDASLYRVKERLKRASKLKVEKLHQFGWNRDNSDDSSVHENESWRLLRHMRKDKKFSLVKKDRSDS